MGDAYRPVAVGQHPIATWKHNQALNRNEPASIMADSQGAATLRSPKERRKRPVSASTYLMSTSPLENELLVADHVNSHRQLKSPASKYGERASFLDEKEVATALVPSRWK